MSNGRLEYYKAEKKHVDTRTSADDKQSSHQSVAFGNEMNGDDGLTGAGGRNKSASHDLDGVESVPMVNGSSHPLSQHPLGVIMLDAIEDIGLRKHRGTTNPAAQKGASGGSSTGINGNTMGASPILLELIAFKTGRDKLKKYTLMAETVAEGNKWLKVTNTAR